MAGIGESLLIAGISAAVSVGSQVAQNLIRGPIEADGLDQSLGKDQGEGSPISLCFGQRAVCRPARLWWRPFQETSTHGGVFSGEREVVRTFCDVAYALAEGPQDHLERFYLGGKLAWTNQTDIEITSDLIGLTRFPIKGTGGSVKQVQLRVSSPQDGPDLTVFQAGERLTLLGSSEPDNNGSEWKIARTSFDADGNTYLWLKNRLFRFLGEDDPAGDPITLSQNLKRFNRRMMKELRFYPGDGLQLPDDHIELYEGVGEVPAYRGISYVVIKRLRLDPYGRSLPTDNRAVVASSVDPVPVADVVRAVATKSRRLTDADIDVTGVTGIVDGITLNPATGKDRLEHLAISHNLMSQERDKKIYFFTRDQAPVVEIDPKDLGTHRLGSDGVRNFEVSEPSDVEIPAKVTVRYFDPQRGFDGGAHEEPQLAGDGDDERVIDLPLTLTSPIARGIGARVRWLLEANRQRVRLPLHFKYLHLQENDVARWVDENGKEWNVLLNRTDKRDDGIISCEGLQEEQSATEFERTADPPGIGEQDVYVPADLQTVVVETAPLRPDIDRPGVLWAVAREDRSNDFADATLFKSEDDITYDPVDFTNLEGTVGFCLNKLQDSPDGVWDEVNTLDIQVVGRELESATKAEVEVGYKNLCLVGEELLCYRDVFVPAGAQPGVYTISKFLRGIGNTNRFKALHAATESFVLLDGAPAQFLPLPTADVGASLFFKAMAAGGELDDTISEELTLVGESVRPWAPTHVRWTRRSTGTAFQIGVQTSWIPRVRGLGPIIGPKPLLEPIERYRIRIIDGPGGADLVDPPYTVTNLRFFNYTDIQRAADGVPAGPVRLAISQYSNTLDAWGHEVEAVVDA